MRYKKQNEISGDLDFDNDKEEGFTHKRKDKESIIEDNHKDNNIDEKKEEIKEHIDKEKHEHHEPKKEKIEIQEPEVVKPASTTVIKKEVSPTAWLTKIKQKGRIILTRKEYDYIVFDPNPSDYIISTERSPIVIGDLFVESGQLVLAPYEAVKLSTFFSPKEITKSVALHNALKFHLVEYIFI